MVEHSYFAHEGRDGSQPAERIRAAGYLSSAGRWRIGENLAWGTGELATPKAIMAAWMDSAGHRANILQPAYREIGFGVLAGNPASRAAAARRSSPSSASSPAPRRRPRSRSAARRPVPPPRRPAARRRPRPQGPRALPRTPARRARRPRGPRPRALAAGSRRGRVVQRLGRRARLG